MGETEELQERLDAATKGYSLLSASVCCFLGMAEDSNALRIEYLKRKWSEAEKITINL
jgi:hypothetical protein